MTCPPVIAARWRSLTAAARPDVADTVLADLVAAYGADGRHYHDLAHIAALLTLVADNAQQWHDRTTVELAVFFHDAVYDVSRADNEQRSADLAMTRMRDLGFDEARCRRVAALIEATTHRADATPSDPDTARFLDLDLSILAAPRAAYEAYASAIRREYAIYPDAQYDAGRRRVLAAFLARPRIYLCNDLHARWDATARDNLTWELRRLERPESAR